MALFPSTCRGRLTRPPRRGFTVELLPAPAEPPCLPRPTTAFITGVAVGEYVFLVTLRHSSRLFCSWSGGQGDLRRGIYDNTKIAVKTIFVGKGRLYNRGFLQMCSQYLVDPVA